MPNCLLRSIEACQRDCEMKMRLGGLLVDFDSAPEQPFGIGEIGLLQSNHAQAVHRTEVPIIGFQDQLVKLRRLPKSPLVVKRDRSRKHLQRQSRKLGREGGAHDLTHEEGRPWTTMLSDKPSSARTNGSRSSR